VTQAPEVPWLPGDPIPPDAKISVTPLGVVWGQLNLAREFEIKDPSMLATEICAELRDCMKQLGEKEKSKVAIALEGDKLVFVYYSDGT
jgi:hypothetical protein